MSYDTKISSACDIITSHNSNVSKEYQIDFDKFLNSLQREGGTTEGALSQCSWEFLQEKTGLPLLLSRQISKIFRSNSNGNDKTSYLSEHKVKSLSIKELLERYNPKNTNDSVSKQLMELSKGKKCIIFNEDDSINIDKSAELLEEIRQGYPEIDITHINQVPQKVYKVGEQQPCYADENPLYPGRPLRIHKEVCDQTGRSWEGISKRIRQLLYIAITETKELKINTIDDAHEALDKAISINGENVIRNRYPKAYVTFETKAKLQKLPSLKIEMSYSDAADSFGFPASNEHWKSLYLSIKRDEPFFGRGIR